MASVITIVWDCVLGVLAIATPTVTGSVALAAFGLMPLIEQPPCSSSDGSAPSAAMPTWGSDTSVRRSSWWGSGCSRSVA